MDFPNNGRWIVACSGGSDSMALLDMCFQREMDIVVITINYHKRETAQRDVKIVTDYCGTRKIPFEIIDASIQGPSNFQKKAREFRYRAFHRAMLQYDAQGVLVAHHRDDVLETYLWQKHRGHRVSMYGILSDIVIENVRVIRPLLQMSKKEILEYLNIQNIQFGEDESNQSTVYARNRIRKQLNLLSEMDKERLLLDMVESNQQLEAQNQRVALIVELMKEEFSIHVLKEFTLPVKLDAFQRWLWSVGYDAKTSRKELEEWLRQLECGVNRWIQLKKGWFLSSNQEKVRIVEQFSYDYCFIFDRIEFVHTPYFRIENQGKIREGILLKEDDWPITIRNWQPADTIELSFGHKKVSRWFIDHKVPKEKRLDCPVVVNCHAQIIYVWGIGADINHFSDNPSLFVLK